jgi:hypothetical protein
MPYANVLTVVCNIVPAPKTLERFLYFLFCDTEEFRRTMFGHSDFHTY